MTPRFHKFVNDFVFPHECHFKKGHWGDMNFVTWEDVDGDAGGVTKYGIDQRSHPGINIKALTKDEAEAIYWRKYWLPINADALPEGWGEVLADIKINGGNGPEMAQKAMNEILTRDGEETLIVDGDIGPKSIAAMERTGDEGLRRLLVRRDARYRTLAAKPYLAKFLKGWLARNEDLRKFVGLGRA